MANMKGSFSTKLFQYMRSVKGERKYRGKRVRTCSKPGYKISKRIQHKGRELKHKYCGKRKDADTVTFRGQSMV